MPLFTLTSFLWPVWPAKDLSQLSGVTITFQVTVTEGEPGVYATKSADGGEQDFKII